MSDPMNPMTTGERYSSAVESSNLRLGERRGDADYIIAAGLVPNGMASALYRLQVEYDSVRVEHHAAEQRMRDTEAFAKRQRDDKPLGPDEDPEKRRPKTAEQKAAELLKAAEGAALTSHVLILSQLQSLREAKALFGQYAVVAATKRRFMQPDRVVLALAGRVLDVFLNPRCRHCEGRGFTGGGRHEHTSPEIFCRPCRGSGQRRDMVGETQDERNFAGHLQMLVDALMFDVQKQIRTGLNRVEQAKMAINEAGG